MKLRETSIEHKGAKVWESRIKYNEGKKSKTKGWMAKKGEDKRREEKSGGLVRREEKKELTGGGNE